MICLVVAADPTAAPVRHLSALSESLGFETRAVSGIAAALADPAAAEGARATILVPDLPGGPGLEEVLALARQDRAFVVRVAATLPPDAYKALVRAGGEWIGWETCAEELRDLLRTRGAAELAERGAKIVSFLPSKGGVGNTLLALETGVHLSARKGGGRVAVLDLNLQGGTLADALDVEPRLDVAEIVARPERLDEQLIDVFTSRAGPRLDLFAGPGRRIALDAVPAPIVFTFIDALSKRYEAIVVDLPAFWLPWIDNVLQGSDAVVLTGGATVPALRRLSTGLTALDALAIPEGRLAVAVNGCEADLFGRVGRRGEIERAIGPRNTFLIRRDAGTACGALDAGRSVAESAPRSGLGRDVRGLAGWCGTAIGLG